jgi:hypothetical protein
MRKKSQVCNHDSKACGVFVLFYKGILWEFVVCPKRKLVELHNQTCFMENVQIMELIKNFHFALLNLLVEGLT